MIRSKDVWVIVEKRQTSSGAQELEHDTAETIEEATALAQRLKDKEAQPFGSKSEFFIERVS